MPDRAPTRSHRSWSTCLRWPLAMLLVVLLVHWPVSFWRGPMWAGGPDRTGFSYLFRATNGQFAFVRRETPLQISGWGMAIAPPSSSGWWRPKMSWRTTPGAGRIFTLYIPIWMPIVMLAAATAVAWRRSRAVPPGHCPRCRYDLSGLTSAACPECGGAQ